MADYQKMYYILCDSVSKALDTLPETEENRVGRELLQKALYDTKI